MDKFVCKPAIVYLVVSLIMLFTGIIIRMSTINMATTFSQLSSVLICTLLLMGLCNIAPEISWIITIIFILCTIVGLATMVINMIEPSMP